MTVEVGDPCVGKTCLLTVLSCGSFPGECTSRVNARLGGYLRSHLFLVDIITCFDNPTTNLVVDNKLVVINFWDTNGQEDYVQKHFSLLILFLCHKHAPLFFFLHKNSDPFFSSQDKLRPLSYPQTDMFIVIYDVTKRQTFENAISKWIPEVRFFSERNYCGKNCEKICEKILRKKNVLIL
jgi:GTPase SAR1 family protein